MNEEKDLNEELNETESAETAAEETVNETVEAPAEETEAAADEAVEAPAEETDAEAATAEAVETAAGEAAEAVEEAEVNAETPGESAVDTSENPDEAISFDEAAVINADEQKKSLPTAKIALGAVAVLVVAAIIVLAIIFAPRLFNKYNKAGYVDVSGRTIAEVAESAGMDLKDFLDSYGLPSDMPANTSESAAYYTIPCSRMATMYGMDFETLKSTLELPDTVTEDTPWGEAEGEARLSVYVGEDNLDSFKEQYGLGDEVNGDTQWKEIRNIVDEYNRQQRIESEKAEKEAAKNADNADNSDNAAVPAETEATDAPAE